MVKVTKKLRSSFLWNRLSSEQRAGPTEENFGLMGFNETIKAIIPR